MSNKPGLNLKAILRLEIGNTTVINSAQPQAQRLIAEGRRHLGERRFRIRSMTEYKQAPVAVTRLA